MSEQSVLEINGLSVAFEGFEGTRQVLRDIGLRIASGRVVALVGETGAGKSVLVQAIMRLLPQTGVRESGRILLDGQDLRTTPEATLRTLRGSAMGLVVTNPRARLNPVQNIGGQLVDALAAHGTAAREALQARALELMHNMGIPDPERRMSSYPHELSGGMCQRIVIAMAIANRPRLLLADEPTAGLDVTIQLQIMELMQRLVRELGSGVLLVTRDLGLAAHFADDVIVMRSGEIVETQPTRSFFAAPRDPYSAALITASRSLMSRAGNDAPQVRGAQETAKVLEVEGLTKHFPLGRNGGFVYAVNGVSFSIARGETLALVGESGSGKTTTGRLVLGLTRPTSGRVSLLGQDLTAISARDLRRVRPRMQTVFQEPSESLNPRFTISRSIEEPLLYRGGMDAGARRRRVAELLEMVRLPEAVGALYPHQISAGQQQRAAIARAVATDPDLVILDEPTSSLDISVRAEILLLLRNLQAEIGLSYLFISHDLSAVQQLSHRIAIMYLGSIVEIGTTDAVFGRQMHPYGRALLSSVLAPDPEQIGTRLTLTGEIPSPVRKPSGCPLVGRCPIEVAGCATRAPALEEIGNGHLVACHRVGDVLAAGSIESLAHAQGRLQAEGVLPQ